MAWSMAIDLTVLTTENSPNETYNLKKKYSMRGDLFSLSNSFPSSETKNDVTFQFSSSKLLMGIESDTYRVSTEKVSD